MSVMGSFRAFWNARQPREQRILALGAVLVLLLLLWQLLIEPATEGRSRWQRTLPTLRSQLAHLRALAAERPTLPSTGATAASAAEFSRASIERSLKDKGLEVQNLTLSDSGVSANFNNVTFAALTEWLQQLPSSVPLRVSEARITARDIPGRVDAQLNLQRLP